MHTHFPVVYPDDTESVPQFESLPDNPADESRYWDELLAAMECDFSGQAPPVIVRTKAECRSLDASTGEAFGQIVPESTADFLELVRQCHGCNDFIVVAIDGRVLLASGQVGPHEAQAIGGYVAKFNMTPGRMADELRTRIVVERRGEFFKGVLVLPNSDRIEAAGVCVSEADARRWGHAYLIERRSTLRALAVAAVNAA